MISAILHQYPRLDPKAGLGRRGTWPLTWGRGWGCPAGRESPRKTIPGKTQNRHHLCPLGSLPPALPPAQAFLALSCEKIPSHLSLLPLPTPHPYHFHKILPYIVFCLSLNLFFLIEGSLLYRIVFFLPNINMIQPSPSHPPPGCYRAPV